MEPAGFVLLCLPMVIIAALALTVAHAVRYLTFPARCLAGGKPSDYGLAYERVTFASQDGTVEEDSSPGLR
jgi:hypothetical protein